MSEAIDAMALFDSLPAPASASLLPLIQRRLAASEQRFVILDDDPTGGQSLHGLPVLASWDRATLAAEMERSRTFFVVTNSRSLNQAGACAVAREAGAALGAIAEEHGYDLVLGYRGDSTLRGHFPSECDALHTALTGRDEPPTLIFAPYFAEGGRFTVDDTQYVLQGDRLVPAARTEFARDPRFAYQHSHLPSWLEARIDRLRAHEVVCITIDDLRRGGPDAVTAKLLAVPESGVALMNAACDRDVEVFVLGLLDAEAAGRRFLYRISASFVRVRAGIAPRPLLSSDELGSGGGPGLIVVGSYVQRTSEQLALLSAEDGLAVVELDVGVIIGSPEAEANEVRRVSFEVLRAMASGTDVVLHTSRRFVEAAGIETEHIGARITGALCEVVGRLDRRPGFLIIKGGSTAHGVVKAGLGMRRGVVMGQILPGVPVWQLGPESRYPDLPVVIFPGNVGEAGALAEARRRLRGEANAGLGL